MDDSWTLGTIHHDQFEKVSRAIRSDDQVTDRVVGHLLDDGGVVNGVVDVGIVDPVSSSRGQDIHTAYCTTKPPMLLPVVGVFPNRSDEPGDLFGDPREQRGVRVAQSPSTADQLSVHDGSSPSPSQARM